MYLPVCLLIQAEGNQFLFAAEFQNGFGLRVWAIETKPWISIEKANIVPGYFIRLYIV